MKATLSVAVLVLALSVRTSFAVDFLLPMSSRMTEELLQETKALCKENVKICWMLSYYKISEFICATDENTYNGECHLCFGILYEGRTIIKMHDGQCKISGDVPEHKLLSTESSTAKGSMMTDSSKIPNLGVSG
nr:serine protease inhibitor Kazal-type 8 [Meriones unguiculatus]